MRRIRWTRTIVFDGPEDIVLDVMTRAWIHQLGKINPPRVHLDVECTEYKVETYDTYDTQENTSEISQS